MWELLDVKMEKCLSENTYAILYDYLDNFYTQEMQDQLEYSLWCEIIDILYNDQNKSHSQLPV